MVSVSDSFHVDEKVQRQSQLGGWIFNIQRYSINDGPGIRATVFFKGCPLRCLWCSNPESQELSPQLLFFEASCVKCYRCVQVCPAGATTRGPDGKIEINRELCKACGACVEACLSDARTISGKFMKLEEVLDIIKRDIPFYRKSGGGVTASGGEPTYQPDFLRELFRQCQNSGLHTALDTCGYVRWQVLQKILEYVDLVLFDIKHMDPEIHRRFTGIDNQLILENARRIARKRKPMIMRMPLIPGNNDSPENIKSVAEFMNQMGLQKIDLLPYHRLGVSKYRRMGKEYQLSEVKSYNEEEVQRIKGLFESYGLEVSIS